MIDSGSEFAVRAVIDEGANGDARDKLRDAADVVVVKVGDEDVVDLREAGRLRLGDDAVGVAAIVAGPATQGAFLDALGIRLRAERLKRGLSADASATLDQAVGRLTEALAANGWPVRR